MTPRVSIVIPLYNLGEYIDDAVSSVLNQTYTNWDLVIINDGSTEKLSIEKVKKYEELNDKRVKVLNEQNKGLVKARNFAAKYTNGEFIIFLDADDKLRNDYIEKCLEVFHNNDLSTAFVTSDYKYFGNKDSYIDLPHPNIPKMLIKNYVHTASMIRKKPFDEINGYDPKFTGYMDWDLWLSLIERGYDWKVVKEPIFEYRVRYGSMVTKSVEKFNELFTLIFNKHKKLYSKYYYEIIPELQSRYMQLHKELDFKNQHIDKIYEDYQNLYKELKDNQSELIAIKNTNIYKTINKFLKLVNRKH